MSPCGPACLDRSSRASNEGCSKAFRSVSLVSAAAAVGAIVDIRLRWNGESSGPTARRGARPAGRDCRPAAARVRLGRRGRGLVFDLGRARVDRHPCLPPIDRAGPRRRGQVSRPGQPGNAAWAGPQDANCAEARRGARLAMPRRRPVAGRGCVGDGPASDPGPGCDLRSGAADKGLRRSSLGACTTGTDRRAPVRCIRPRWDRAIHRGGPPAGDAAAATAPGPTRP